jgi:hypothetical protein
MTPERIVALYNSGVSVKTLTMQVLSRMQSDYAQVTKHGINETAPTMREAQRFVERVIFEAMYKTRAQVNG